MGKVIMYIFNLCFIVIFALLALKFKPRNKNRTRNSDIDDATLENLKGVRESLRPSEQKKCSYCGSRVKNGSARCESCGARLDK